MNQQLFTVVKLSSSSQKTGFASKSKYHKKPKNDIYIPHNLYFLCLDNCEHNSPSWNTIMTNKCFIHLEETNYLRKVPIKYLPLSKSFPSFWSDINELFKFCDIVSIDTKWISLPAYVNKSDTSKILDFQCATTGTKSSLDEKFETTSERECAEENGILVEEEDLVGYKEFKYGNNNERHVKAFVYYVNQIKKPIFDEEKYVPIPKETEDSNQKIMSFILFDDPAEIVNRKRISSKITNDFAGEATVVMQVSDLKNLIQLCFNNKPTW